MRCAVLWKMHPEMLKKKDEVEGDKKAKQGHKHGTRYVLCRNMCTLCLQRQNQGRISKAPRFFGQ